MGSAVDCGGGGPHPGRSPSLSGERRQQQHLVLHIERGGRRRRGARGRPAGRKEADGGHRRRAGRGRPQCAGKRPAWGPSPGGWGTCPLETQTTSRRLYAPGWGSTGLLAAGKSGERVEMCALDEVVVEEDGELTMVQKIHVKMIQGGRGGVPARAG